MDEIESEAQSFIVKVWVEEANRGIWRGHITHVSSGKRRYLKDLGGIGDFIVPYLEGMGVKLGMRWRITRRLKHLLRWH